MHAQNRLLASFFLALSMSLVGSYVALSKALVLVFPVFLLAWLRFGIGALAIAHWLKKPADELPLSRHTHALLFLESFLGNFLFSICMLYGMTLTSAVSAGVIMAAIPAAVALLSWWFLGERIGLRLGAAVAFAVLGIALTSLSKQEQHVEYASALDSDLLNNQAFVGNLLLVAAVLCEAAYSVIGKKLTGVLGPKRITALINLWGLALVTPMGLVLALRFDFNAVSTGHWGLLVGYALAASVGTVWLWMTGLKHVPAAQAGIFTVMLPIAAAAVGVLVLGESLSGMQLLAFGFALLGVVLATLPSSQ